MGIDEIIVLFTGSPNQSLSLAVLVLALVLLFLTLLSTSGYFPILLSITSYISIVARLKAKGVPFIEPERVQELMQTGSVQDCMSRLKGLGYLTTLPLECTADQVEEELLIAWFEEVSSLRSQAPRDAWLFFDAFFLFQEITKVKRILRLVHIDHAAIISKQPKLWPLELNGDLAAKLGNVHTMSEGIRLLHETKFGKPLLLGITQYEKEKNLFFLEHALDCMGFSELKSQMSMVQTTLASPYRDFLAHLIDIHNLRVLIRAKHSGWIPEKVSLCLVEGGMELPLWRLIQMNEMMSVPDVVRQLTATPYDQILTPLLRSYPSPDVMLRIDLALDQYLLQVVSRLGLAYYHTGGPLLWYLIAKEFELRNIRIILSGLIEGLSPEQISWLVITQREET